MLFHSMLTPHNILNQEPIRGLASQYEVFQNVKIKMPIFLCYFSDFKCEKSLSLNYKIRDKHLAAKHLN